MLREKLVRAAASRWVVICDACKRSEGLGVDFPVPVEVAPAFHQRTLRRLAKLTGADARLRLGLAPAGRPGSDMSGKPFVTDNGNYVVDLFFREPLGDVWLMASQLDACPGAVEHGLFPASMRPDDPLVGRGMGAWSGNWTVTLHGFPTTLFFFGPPGVDACSCITSASDGL